MLPVDLRHCDSCTHHSPPLLFVLKGTHLQPTRLYHYLSKARGGVRHSFANFPVNEKGSIYSLPTNSFCSSHHTGSKSQATAPTMLRVAGALLVLAACIGTITATAVPPPLPGLCVDGVGTIGCSFDATKLDAFCVTLNPLQPVVEFDWCNDTCYEPANRYSPQCLYCTFTNPIYPNMTYR